MDYQVIDNFLPDQNLKELQELLVWNNEFPFLLKQFVANGPSSDKFDTGIEIQNWSWYGVHQLYNHIPQSPLCNSTTAIFLEEFEKLEVVRALIRSKVNFYPWTDKVYEHAKHSDYPYEHKAAVYSLNTCDGYTRMPNGDKVDRVANRIVLFDGSKPHASSTTSNAKGRFNINFNWV